MEVSLAELELGLGRWLAAVALGAVVGLDATSFPQVMISRPIVAATLGGILFGNPEAGFLVGFALELLLLRHPPFGAVRYPDPGPAGLTAGAAYAGAGATGMAPLLVALLAGWAVSWLGALAVERLRRVNERLVGQPKQLVASAARLERRHRLAMRLDAARSALLTGAFLFPALAGARLAASAAPAPFGNEIVPLAVAAGLAASAGTAGRSLGASRRAWPLLAGGAVLALLWL